MIDSAAARYLSESFAIATEPVARTCLLLPRRVPAVTEDE